MAIDEVGDDTADAGIGRRAASAHALTRGEQERAFLLKQAMREVLAEHFTTQDPAARKELVKEAITEWLNEKYAAFGRYSLLGIAAAALGLLTYYLLMTKGWTPPR